jgi:hypothetical protein
MTYLCDDKNSCLSNHSNVSLSIRSLELDSILSSKKALLRNQLIFNRDYDKNTGGEIL